MTNNSFTTRLEGDVDIYNYKHLCKYINRKYDSLENYDITEWLLLIGIYTEMRSYS